MRALALLLLMLNLALFAVLRGLFGELPASGREPARLEQQIAPERIRVLTDRDVQLLRRRAGESAAAAAAPAPGAAAAEPTGCMEVGDFAGDGALARLRDRLGELKLAEHVSEQAQEVAGWYALSVPAGKSRAEAERRAEELRGPGARDPLVVALGASGRFEIELGDFRDREAARKVLAQLERRGVKGARVADSSAAVQITRVRIRGLEAAALQQLEALQKDFPQQKMQACAPAPAP